MGQAAVDLPDPINTPEPSSRSDSASSSSTATVAPPASGADDLLAQLAGEEIDRLLAEAESGKPEPRPSTAPPATQAQPAATSEAQPATSASTSGSTTLGALLDDVSHNPAVSVPEKSPTDRAQPSQPTAGDQPTVAERELDAILSGEPAPDAGADAISTIAEMSKSVDEAAALLGEVEKLQSAGRVSESADGGPEPLLVRVLEFLNAPAAVLPDAARDAIGKIAILTLFNSIAVLLYIMLFRRHH